jgi:hypothetical protein
MSSSHALADSADARPALDSADEDAARLVETVARIEHEVDPQPVTPSWRSSPDRHHSDAHTAENGLREHVNKSAKAIFKKYDRYDWP